MASQLQIIGSELVRTFGAGLVPRGRKELQSVDANRGWWPVIRESFAGAWQRNIEIRQDSVLSFHAVFACQTLIASDISKMRVKLVQKDANGIWSETSNSAYSPVLRKPNHYQNRIQFFESWVLSKLQSGNAYILKQRDARQVVTRLYVLDPNRVRPMVSDSGEVFYELRKDALSTQPQDTILVPQREIIHDRFNCFFHPLVGLSPIFANGLAAMQGLAIQNNSTRFFENAARPSGILTAPGDIKQETADQLKAYWESNFSGTNTAKIAVLGDGLKYEAMTMTNVDAQTIEQLKWTAEVVCSTYHLPSYKIGVGALPSYNNVQALNVEYYSQCLQKLVEDIELCLDEGLGIGDGVTTNGATYGTEFDVDNLLRMDSVTQFDVAQKAKGTLTLDEVRRRLDVGPVEGGDTIYLQIQDHSLAAIAARDAQLIDEVENPPPPAPAVPVPVISDEDKSMIAAQALRRELRLAA
jgi:HK97 family phage portal protein